MGANAARITVQDFLTPPELASWPLSIQAPGRVGGVRIELSDGPEGTVLSQCYQQVPLRVLPPFRLGTPSMIYLLNPTAGLMDGDAHLMQICARRGSRGLVAGQSATRIHPATTGFCTQQWEVHVEAGAVLVVLPGPAIPFLGSRYYQRVRIELEKDAGLIWGDLWHAGRYARGPISEQFQFHRLIQDFSIRREGRLIFRDRFEWQGPWDAETATWYFGPHLGCGSLFVTGNIDESLVGEEKSCQKAFFPTKAGDTCLRWLGSPEAVTEGLIETALKLAGALSSGQSSKPWLLPFHDLAPNHWFLPAYYRSPNEGARGY